MEVPLEATAIGDFFDLAKGNRRPRFETLGLKGNPFAISDGRRLPAYFWALLLRAFGEPSVTPRWVGQVSVAVSKTLAGKA